MKLKIVQSPGNCMKMQVFLQQNLASQRIFFNKQTVIMNKRNSFINICEFNRCVYMCPVSKMRAICQQIGDRFPQKLLADWHPLCPQ